LRASLFIFGPSSYIAALITYVFEKIIVQSLPKLDLNASAKT